MSSLESSMNIAIIDVECTCDDIEPLVRNEVEIIEIGGVILSISDKNCDLIDEFQIFVKPEVHKELTQFCIKLTGIDQDTVNQGFSLSSALIQTENIFRQYNVVTWGSWGKFDFTQFEIETSEKNLNNPLSEMIHVNVKQLYARKMKHRVGLAKAIILEKMQFEGRNHCGIDDAKNIARIIASNDIIKEAVLSRIRLENN